MANLPLAMQPKLMRLLQEGEVRLVGSNRGHQVDVRIITASSVPRHNLEVQQKFREDWYCRWLVYPLQVPSLEERREDIPLRAEHFLNNTNSAGNAKSGQEIGSCLHFALATVKLE